MSRFVLAGMLFCFAGASLATLPTVDDVFKSFRANQAKLDRLHLQFTQTEEHTEAFQKSERQNAERMEALAKLLESGQKIPELEKVGYTAEQVRKQAKYSRLSSKSKVNRFDQNYELFIAGDSYQVRSLLSPHEKDSFPTVALTANSLPREYAFVRIYSHSPKQTPVGRVWPGQPSPNSMSYAMLTSKHVNDTQLVHIPPFMSRMHPRWDMEHQIDTFYGAAIDRYRVVGQEKIDGRLLTIVEAIVPTVQQSDEVGKDGKVITKNVTYCYRAWLDLERGAIPMMLKCWSGFEGELFDDAARRWSPSHVTTTKEIKKLENGGYYPAVTSDDALYSDPNAPQLNESELAQVKAGKRPAPPSVVFLRYTWSCSVVDTNVPAGDAFFVLNFPKGQAFFDLDTGKTIGALERKPFIKAGE